ncbi:phosphoribosylanthranilate isomerase [Lentisphaerota bacterium ZTH]|nr:phosphoribosylanthranilate isomerase [Lentisphaerota bacterium]WET06423.1 phosphoribosylanthranilate isomerase [Lentisphaerota bacterium ZTH]
MRVKICGIQNEHDLTTAVMAGADAVGFLVGQIHKSSAFILPSTANRLAKILPPYITPVIVTHLTKAEDIKEILLRADIYTVQLHGIDQEEIYKLRDILPPFAKIIIAEYTHSLKKNTRLDEIYPVIDAVTLDCFNCEPALIGQESDRKKYQWRIGAEFVSSCPKPVILSGGLAPENVEQAIKDIRPYGVDACSSLREAETSSCEQKICKEYVRNAKKAFLTL